ncbi:hypothetical protein BS47DRAFT_1277484, partial [Hydnum rufescens UP504]
NPDVAGIGIRVSIYITTLIISLIPDIDETKRLRSDLMTAAGLNGFSLLVPLIGTANRSLTLYHAVLITHLLTFLGITTNPAGSYRPSASRLRLYWITTWMVFVLLLCWTMYMWATAPTFGPPGACNDATIYVLLFVNVRATVGWLRWIFVTAEAIALFVLVCVPIVAILAVWNLGNSHVGRDERPNSTSMGALSTISNTKLYFQTSSASGRGLVGRFLASIYGVTMLELTIHRNKKYVVGDENQWAFGQIAAMVIAIGSLNEVLQFLLPED